MQLTEKERQSLRDIVDNAERIAEYTRGMDRDAFVLSALARDATERCLARISEAATRIRKQDGELVAATDFDWVPVHDLGNILRHVYDRVNPEVIWTIVTEQLPGLERRARDWLGEQAET